MKIMSKSRWRPKKRSSTKIECVFGPKVKTKKRSSPEIECVFGPNKWWGPNKLTKWCHPKMMTPGAGCPPLLATPLHTVGENGDKNCFETWELCLFRLFSFYSNYVAQSSQYCTCFASSDIQFLALLSVTRECNSKTGPPRGGAGGTIRVVSRAGLFGFGPKVDENFGLNSGLRCAFCLRCTKI